MKRPRLAATWERERRPTWGTRGLERVIWVSHAVSRQTTSIVYRIEIPCGVANRRGWIGCLQSKSQRPFRRITAISRANLIRGGRPGRTGGLESGQVETALSPKTTVIHLSVGYPSFYDTRSDSQGLNHFKVCEHAGSKLPAGPQHPPA